VGFLRPHPNLAEGPEFVDTKLTLKTKGLRVGKCLSPLRDGWNRTLLRIRASAGTPLNRVEVGVCFSRLRDSSGGSSKPQFGRRP
jgi:hypothetical protein